MAEPHTHTMRNDIIPTQQPNSNDDVAPLYQSTTTSCCADNCDAPSHLHSKKLYGWYSEKQRCYNARICNQFNGAPCQTYASYNYMSESGKVVILTEVSTDPNHKVCFDDVMSMGCVVKFLGANMA